MKLILASNSPRRKEILNSFGYHFEVASSNFEESSHQKDPRMLTIENAVGKAKGVFDTLDDNDVIVLGADTIVYFNGKILGKPENVNDAFNTLKLLSGRIHSVFTGYAIISSKGITSGCTCSKVEFNLLTDEVIKEYIKTGSPMDKAGSYGVQDGYNLVKSVKGSLNNVIGLPIEDLKPLLDKFLEK